MIHLFYLLIFYENESFLLWQHKKKFKSQFSRLALAKFLNCQNKKRANLGVLSVHWFQELFLGKGMNPIIIPPAMGK